MVKVIRDDEDKRYQLHRPLTLDSSFVPLSTPSLETVVTDLSPVPRRLNTGCSLLDVCPSLLDFISSVVNKTSSDPGVLSFALKLTGLLAATEEGFTRLQVELVTLYYYFTKSRLLNSLMMSPPCRNVHFWTRHSAFSAGRQQGSGRILVSGLVGSMAWRIYCSTIRLLCSLWNLVISY